MIMILDNILCNNYCYFCGIPLLGDLSVCTDCIEKISSARKAFPVCPHCSFPFVLKEKECAYCHLLPESIDRLMALSGFQGVNRELLYLYKSGRMKNLRYYYADRLHNLFLHAWSADKEVRIVPVPPRKNKIRKQGWDQIRLLARTLQKKYDYKTADILVRKDAVQQKSLSREDRLHHLQENIELKRGGATHLKKVEILVILDDVFTTGATLSACASVLKNEYSLPVNAAVLCSVT